MKSLVITLIVAAAPLVAPAQDATPHPAALPGAPSSSDAVPGEAAAAAPQAVFIGVGMGTVRASRSSDTPAEMRIRAGAVRSSRLVVGFEGGVMAASAHLQFYDVGATWFPWGGRFFVRGALGITTEPRGEGPNALAGLGVSFGGRRGWNLSLNLEAQTHRTGELWNGSPGTDTLSAWVGLDWY